MNNKIKCAVYARDSTDKQGDTVENQLTQGKEYIRRLGDGYDSEDVAEFIDHAVSGYYTSVFDREAMKEAVTAAKNKKFEVIIFKEISRVGRDKQENPAIVGIFEQYGIRVIAINDNYDSKNKDNITFDILSVLAEQESRKTSVRVSSGKQQKARRGLWNTDAPIGYKLNSDTKKLEADPETRGIIETIFDLYVNNGIGTFLIAKHLNDKGYKTRDNNLFSRESVKRILSNPVYIGNTVYGKKRNELKREYDDAGKMTKKKVQVQITPKDWTVVENTHEPIVGRELFYSAQEILLSRGHHRTPRRAYHPLTGILFCAMCGEGMVCQKRTYKEKEYRYYICKTYHKYGRDACSQANINADKLEQEILDVVKSDLLNAKNKRDVDSSSDRSEDVIRLEAELMRVKRMREKAGKDQIALFEQRELFAEDAYQSQMMSLKTQTISLDKETELLKNKIAAISNEENKIADIVNLTEKFLNVDPTETDVVRILLHSLIKKITISEEDVDIEYRHDII